jgi:hypothetical protein
VEREKQRLADYAAIKPPEGMLSAIEAGFSGASPMNLPAPTPATAMPSVAPVETAQPPGGATAILTPNVPGSDAIRRTPSLSALPKLTAATATPSPKDDEAAATMLVDSSEYFDENDEPRTQPGVERSVTQPEMEQVALGDGDAPPTGKTAVLGPSSGASAQPARPSSTAIPVVTPTPNVQVRPSVFGMAALGAQADAPAVANRTSSPGRPSADGLPRIVRPEPPAGGPPMLSPAGRDSNPSGPGLRPLPPVSHSAPTAPHAAPMGARPSHGARDMRDTQLPPTARPQGSNKMVLFGAIGAGALVVLGVVGFLLMRSPPTGFIMVELPPAVGAKAQVMLNAQPAQVSNNVVLEPVQAGPVMVAVSVEGYKTFTKTVEVQEGKGVTRVVPELEALVRSVSMVLATVPQDAEVTLNGKVVRAQGSQDAFIKDLPASDEMLVEVKAVGFKPFQQKYSPPAGPEPLQVTVKLEPE